jgi:hypothetical protein
LTSTCNKAIINYKLSPDEICPSVLIVSEINDETTRKTIELTPVNKIIFIKTINLN